MTKTRYKIPNGMTKRNDKNHSAVRNRLSKEANDLFKEARLHLKEANDCFKEARLYSKEANDCFKEARLYSKEANDLFKEAQDSYSISVIRRSMLPNLPLHTRKE
jgi:hypothetical protein